MHIVKRNVTIQILTVTQIHLEYAMVVMILVEVRRLLTIIAVMEFVKRVNQQILKHTRTIPLVKINV